MTNNSQDIKWLHFSDCMNNGGTSQLFIDFTPSCKGRKGQIIRLVHDPDELIVIADSFDEYLRNIMCNNYDFIDTNDEENEDNNENKLKKEGKFSLKKLFRIRRK